MPKSLLPLLGALAMLAIAAPVAAEPIKFARYPHVAHGKIVFSYHGDVWIANQDGSNPTRLTAHVGRDTFPRLSPDGRLVDGQIYFASERDEIFNIWRVAPTGGAPAQVTRHRQDGIQFPSISPDGKVIAYENEFELPSTKR